MVAVELGSVTASDLHALERRRLADAARAALVGSGTAITTEQLARLTGRSVDATRRWVQERRGAGVLVTVTHRHRTLIPRFQLTATCDVDAAVADVVARLRVQGMDGWAVWDWFCTPNTWLDGQRPADVIGTNPGAVEHAVAGMFQA